MANCLAQFEDWLSVGSKRDPYFAPTFWFVFSSVPDSELDTSLGLRNSGAVAVPLDTNCTTVAVQKRSGRTLRATFWRLPLSDNNIHVFFSPQKREQATRPMYRLLASSHGTAHLFPIGHELMRLWGRLSPNRELGQTQVLRGVSYPTRTIREGADINLKRDAYSFFSRLEEDKRVLKTVRFAAQTNGSFCEFTVGRAGYASFHRGPSRPFLDHIIQMVVPAMSQSARPFERATGRFVSFRFSQPYFADRSSYATVITALSKLPRTSVALLHSNPYFHATLTNYEDGGEFDIFITGASDVQVQGRGATSAASFLRIQDRLTEQFDDAAIRVEEGQHGYRIGDLLEGRV